MPVITRPSQPRKASVPMDVTVAGIKAEFKAVQALNALLPTVCMPSGKVNSPSPLQP